MLSKLAKALSQPVHEFQETFVLGLRGLLFCNSGEFIFGIQGTFVLGPRDVSLKDL